MQALLALHCLALLVGRCVEPELQYTGRTVYSNVTSWLVGQRTLAICISFGEAKKESACSSL